MTILELAAHPKTFGGNLTIQHFGCLFQVNPLHAAKFRLAFTCHGGTMQPLCPISRPV